MSTATTGGGRNPVEALAEEFLERKRHGEPTTPEEYAEAHPELAEEILVLFPALLMMEDLAGDSGGKTGSLTSGAGAVVGAASGRIGEFRLLREVGRGGMGVVYEAEQESLGRRVALKVLPAGALVDSKQVRRFEREARSAARLHHTNIVPVFGVGHQGGTHFYVMQFIQGQGLDAVLDELRRLRDTRDAESMGPGQRRTDRQRDVSEIARSLATGRFVSGPGEGEAPPGTATLPWSAPEVRPDGPGSAGSGQWSGSAASGVTSLPETDRRFAQGVARIGVQVAEALAYAHGQGILHRDIKPSNLLLDRDGNVWVADFGLAKATGGEDLTHTGDIIGTVRYMAPERFRGEGDARADVYSLGLTLYELLALRPAFEEKDRAALIRQVTQEDPPRLRRLNRRVPADLETIVHKAIAREPAQRYATARAMGEDLQRFLEGRPIRARRVSSAERAWRWCKRNPVVAGLLGTVAALVVAGLVGLSVANVHLSRSAASERTARLEAEGARVRAQAAGREADARRREAEASRAEAERQSKAAEANFARARAAVDESFTKISESRLVNVPGMQPLRRDLLQSALAFYEGFLKERGDDPALRAELASTYLRIGQINTDLGREAESRQALLSAISAYDDELRKQPGNIEIEDRLGDAWATLGDLDFEIGKRRNSPVEQSRKERMFKAYQEAVGVRETVARRRPEVLLYAKKLATAINRLGFAQTWLGMTLENRESQRRCAEIRFDLARRAPDDPEIQYGLGESLLNLALPLQQSGRLEEALTLLRSARAHYLIACAKLPHVIEYRLDLGSCYLEAGQIEWSLGRKDEAVTELRRGVQYLIALARANPAVTSVQGDVLDSIDALIRKQRDLGRTSEVAQTLALAREFIDRLPGESADDLFNQACLRMRYLGLLAADRLDRSEEARAECSRQEDLAFESLRAAVAAGSIGLDRIQGNRDLEPLRERPDFKELLARLASAGVAAGPAKADLAGSGTSAQLRAGTPSIRSDENDSGRADRVIRADQAASLHAIGLLFLGLDQADESVKPLEQALALHEQLVKEDPASLVYQSNLASTMEDLAVLNQRAGRIDRSRELWGRAIPILTRAIAQHPDDRLAWRELGIARTELGREDEAAAAFAKVMELTPESRDEELWWSPDLAGIGEALAGHDAIFARVVRARPRDRNLLIARFHYFGRRERWKEAAEMVARIIELDPNDGWVRGYHRTLLFFIGDIEGYRRAMREALATTMKEIHPNRDGFYEVLGEFEFPRAVATDPPPQGSGEKLSRGYIAYREGRYAEAIPHLRAGAELIRHPLHSALAHLFLAMAHQRLGQGAEARRELTAGREWDARVWRSRGFHDSAEGHLMSYGWTECLISTLVLREAEGLIVYDPVFPVDPFAPH